MSNNRTSPTRPRTVLLAAAELKEVDQCVCKVGSRKDTIPSDRISVISTAQDHNHQSRRSTMRMLSRTVACSVNSWGLVEGTLKRPPRKLRKRRRRDRPARGPEGMGTPRSDGCGLRAVPTDAIYKNSLHFASLFGVPDSLGT